MGVIPQESLDQSQAQSDTREPEPPQIEDISSEGEIPDSDQEDHSGTPVLEELEVYDSLSPVINKTPLWKFTEQTPLGAQTKTQDCNCSHGHINKHMKSCHPAKPWDSKEFFSGAGYPMHNLEGLVPYPESLALPSKPPPTEDQPFLSSTQAP